MARDLSHEKSRWAGNPATGKRFMASSHPASIGLGCGGDLTALLVRCRHALEKIDHHRERDAEIFRRAKLVRMMTEPFATADEKHRDRRQFRDHDRVVPGAAHQVQT